MRRIPTVGKYFSFVMIWEIDWKDELQAVLISVFIFLFIWGFLSFWRSIGFSSSLKSRPDRGGADLSEEDPNDVMIPGSVPESIHASDEWYESDWEEVDI